MANFFSGLFSGNDQPQQPRSWLSPDTFGESADTQDDSQSFMPRFRRQNTMQLPGVSAYRDFIGHVPNREDYEPRGFKGTLGTILAGVAGGQSGGGIGAYRAAGDYRDTPYREAITDWGTKASALKENAELELDQAQRDWQNDKLAQDLGIKMMTESRLRQDSQNLAHYHDEIAKNQARRNDIADAAQRDTASYHKGMITNGAFANMVRQGELGVHRGMLGVAQQNAETNRQGVNQTGQYQRYRMTQGPTHVSSPTDQFHAQQMVMMDLANDPAWKDSFSADDQGRLQLSSKASPALRQLIQSRVNSSLSGQYRLYDEEENSPYSIEPEDQ